MVAIWGLLGPTGESEVTVWAIVSLFVQTTVVPFLMAKACGKKPVESMVTLLVTGAAGGGGGGGGGGGVEAGVGAAASSSSVAASPSVTSSSINDGSSFAG